LPFLKILMELHCNLAAPERSRQARNEAGLETGTDFVEVVRPGWFPVRGGAGRLVFFDLTVPIRWLLLGLLISVGALVGVAAAVAGYIRRQRKAVPQNASAEERKGEE
jgi:hypothetical protein